LIEIRGDVIGLVLVLDALLLQFEDDDIVGAVEFEGDEAPRPLKELVVEVEGEDEFEVDEVELVEIGKLLVLSLCLSNLNEIRCFLEDDLNDEDEEEEDDDEEDEEEEDACDVELG